METALWIETQAEAEAMNAVLHCGTVRVGDDWDTAAAWPETADRALARRILLDWRQGGVLPTEEQRRQLAVCCRE